MKPCSPPHICTVYLGPEITKAITRGMSTYHFLRSKLTMKSNRHLVSLGVWIWGDVVQWMDAECQLKLRMGCLPYNHFYSLYQLIPLTTLYLRVESMHMPCRHKRTIWGNWFLPSTVWILGIGLRSSDLTASTLSLPAHPLTLLTSQMTKSIHRRHVIL